MTDDGSELYYPAFSVAHCSRRTCMKLTLGQTSSTVHLVRPCVHVRTVDFRRFDTSCFSTYELGVVANNIRSRSMGASSRGNSVPVMVRRLQAYVLPQTGWSLVRTIALEYL